jgi:transcriptional regulator with XRE-family HTH domain
MHPRMPRPILLQMSPNADLGTYLKSRRGRVRPEDVGLPNGAGRRRVPGLRREEVAQLAAISVDYYVRLEQGRDLSPSESVIDALARALRLNATERAHLYHLIRPVSRPTPTPARMEIRPGVRLLLDALDRPAFVIGRRLDILATNAAARAMLTDFDSLPEHDRNHARWIFQDPATRALYEDWEVVARENVAILRRDAGRYPGDEELRELIDELMASSPEFASMWDDQNVHTRSFGTKRYRHPVAGPMTVHYEAMALDDPDQMLYVYSVEPGTPSADAMAIVIALADARGGRSPAAAVTDEPKGLR